MRIFKSDESADIQKLRAELAELAPLGEKLRAERATETLARRKEAAAHIERLTMERDKALSELRATLTEKEAHYNEAKKALDQATNEMRAAKSDMSGQTHRLEHEIERHKQALVESADPAIDAAIQFFRDRLDELRRPGQISARGLDIDINIFTDSKTLTTETNKDAVLSALAFCQAAIKALETLKLIPVLDVKRLEKMKRDIPSIDVYTESSGEKPLPRVNTDPFQGLLSDSELEWRKGKLLERAKKILKR